MGTLVWHALGLSQGPWHPGCARRIDTSIAQHLEVASGYSDTFCADCGLLALQGNLPSPSMHSIRSRVYRGDTEDSLAIDASD